MIPSHLDVRASRLRQAREARGMTRAELALLAATTSTEVALLEEGVQAATDKELRRRLLRALDVPFEGLFEVVGVDRFGRASPL